MSMIQNEMQSLGLQVADMGTLTTNMLEGVVALLQDFDEAAINRILDEESQSDDMQLMIDKEAVRILTVFSPVASDLRFALSVTRVSTELERIADHARSICRYTIPLQHSNTTMSDRTKELSTQVTSMVHDAMVSFAEGDCDLASRTIRADEHADAIYDQAVQELIDANSSLPDGDEQVDLRGVMVQILICRSLERIGDQATNICEEVMYMVQGQDVRHQ